jgi:hypothetical protein
MQKWEFTKVEYSILKRYKLNIRGLLEICFKTCIIEYHKAISNVIKIHLTW